jgi:hypothetical protein
LLAPGQQVAFDQGEEMNAEFMGQGFVALRVAAGGVLVCFCFHRPRVWTMG